MPASSALWRLADATSALELHLPAADCAVGDLRLLLDGLLIASSLEQRFDAVALILVVGLPISLELGTESQLSVPWRPKVETSDAQK